MLSTCLPAIARFQVITSCRSLHCALNCFSQNCCRIGTIRADRFGILRTQYRHSNHDDGAKGAFSKTAASPLSLQPAGLLIMPQSSSTSWFHSTAAPVTINGMLQGRHCRSRHGCQLGLLTVLHPLPGSAPPCHNTAQFLEECASATNNTPLLQLQLTHM